MPKEQEQKNIITEGDFLYAQRRLENGGALILFLQAHGETYPRKTIEQDILQSKPDLIIIENVAPQIKGWESGVYLSDDAHHQVELARSLNIPVVFPDVNLGEACPDSPLSLCIREEINRLAVTGGRNLLWFSEAVFVGTASLFILPVLLKSKNIEKMSRRKFLSLAALFAGGAAVTSVPWIFRKGVREALDKTTDSSLAVLGPMEQNLPARIKAKIAQKAITLTGDNDQLFQITFGLRDAKFISTAEAASVCLQEKFGIANPKIGLIVGLAHQGCLEEGKNTGPQRVLAAQKAIENFLVAYKVAQEDPEFFGFPSIESLNYCAVLDLLRISVSSVVGSSFDEKGNTQVDWQGYLFLEDVIMGIQRGLKDTPVFQRVFSEELQKLREYDILKC